VQEILNYPVKHGMNYNFVSLKETSIKNNSNLDVICNIVEPLALQPLKAYAILPLSLSKWALNWSSFAH